MHSGSATRKGIVLAGGSGSRLWPMTLVCNKQLLPIYDKPAIYYPISTLMLMGIREILIISSPDSLGPIRRLLGDGSNLGVELSYAPQNNPGGLPEAFIIGDKFIGEDPVAMILGDNFFHGHAISEILKVDPDENAKVFLYPVSDPNRYGIADIDDRSKIKSVIEKPKNPPSNLAVTGLYCFDSSVVEKAKTLSPSSRGELEITDLINSYISDGLLSFGIFGRGYVWFDMGTPQALISTSNYVEVIQSRQGTSIAALEEVAWRMGFISNRSFENLVDNMPQGDYKICLQKAIT